jgi:hypothetical protein
MVYTIIDDESEIKKNQEIFEKILQHGIGKPEKERKIGPTPKSHIKCDVYWSSELNFWSASYAHKTEKGNRYSNYISFTEPPKDKEYLFEDVNISFSETGRTSSKFVEDGNKVYFAHNGVVGNYHESKDDFMKYYRENDNDVKIIDIDNEKLVLICELSSDEKEYPDLQNKVITFAREANRIKKILDKVEKPKREKARQELKKGWLLCLNKLFEEAKEEEHKDYKEISARDLPKKAEEMRIFNDGIEYRNRFPSVCNAMKSIMEKDRDEETSDNPNSSAYTIKYKLPRIKPIKIENTTDTKDEQQSKNKPESIILIKNSLSEDKVQRAKQPYDIAQRIREIILKINEICRLHNKRDIFDQAALFELWGDIENSCKSKNDFKNFTGSLYKLLREKTRYDNPNKRTKDDPKYIFLLPSNFIKKGTPTRYFWDIVNTLRHYYIHDEIGKIADVWEELLGKDHRSGPESSEDFQKPQIELLKRFETSMEKLLEMVRDELNPDRAH